MTKFKSPVGVECAGEVMWGRLEPSVAGSLVPRGLDPSKDGIKDVRREDADVARREPGPA